MAEEKENKNIPIKTQEDLTLNITNESKENLTKTTKNKNNKNNFKSLAFWLSAVAVLIVVAQIVLNFFGVSFETKIVVEVVSFVLAILVSTGVLITQNKQENFSKTKEEIEKDLNNKIENKK